MRLPLPWAVRRKATSLRKNVSQRTLVLSIRHAIRFDGVRKTRWVAASAGAAAATATTAAPRATRFMRRRAYLESGAHGDGSSRARGARNADQRGLPAAGQRARAGARLRRRGLPDRERLRAVGRAGGAPVDAAVAQAGGRQREVHPAAGPRPAGRLPAG